jgi:hypothetical protein
VGFPTSCAKPVEINKRLDAIAESGMQTGMAAHRECFANARSEVFSFDFTPLALALDAFSQPAVSPTQ